jgi:hypothetical protein
MGKAANAIPTAPALLDRSIQSAVFATLNWLSSDALNWPT